MTDASSGTGECITEQFLEEGATVITVDVNAIHMNIVSRFGSTVVPYIADISQLEAVQELEELIVQRYGKLDIIANNAGIGGTQALIHEYPMDSFDLTISVNARGACTVLQAGLRIMLKQGAGAVVNTASIYGFRAQPLSSAYIISKGAVVMMTRSAALVYGNTSIRIDAVAPGAVATPIIAGLEACAIKALEAQIPQNRLGQPEEVSNVVLFLADSRRYSHVTDQVWRIDGGRSAGWKKLDGIPAVTFVCTGSYELNDTSALVPIIISARRCWPCFDDQT